MQVKLWKHILQSSENYNNIPESTKKSWKIFRNATSKTECAIYLMECTICNLQYVSKNETLCLIQRENFWIQKLETLYPKGLNQELNI